jgi:hypothetical protein
MMRISVAVVLAATLAAGVLEEIDVHADNRPSTVWW